MANQISFLDIFRSMASPQVKLWKVFDYLIGGMVAFFLPPVPVKPWPAQIRRILIIRPGGIGDAVFLLPILKVFKSKGMSISILCESRNAEVFTSQGYEVYLYNQFNQLALVLKNSFDLVVDTEQWHYLSALVGYVIKTEYRIGFATRPLRAKLFNKQAAYGENDYELDNFKKLFDGVLLLQGINDINGCFHIPDDIKTWALKLIPDRSITIFLGASIALRRFSKKQLLLIIHDVLSKTCNPVLLGGKDVDKIAHQVTQEVNDNRVFNFVGELSLMQSAALIQRSQKFIGPDSGLMHLACAVGTPVVAVFGPGNLSKWGPKGNQHQVITENVSCAPCTRFGYTIPTCRGSYHCVKTINIEKITASL